LSAPLAAVDWLTARPIAHRGYHDAAAGRIENTLAAAEAAIARDFAIECDVQASADGHVVVFHDDTLDRLTEAKGPLAAMSLDALTAIRFKRGDARIPTLEELLGLIDGRVPLAIEIKSAWSGDRRLEAAVAATLSTYIGPVAVMSFDPRSMAEMRRLAPGIRRGLIADRFKRSDWTHLSTAARLANRHLASAPFTLPSFVAYGIKALPALAPLALRRIGGMPILTWTVRTAADRARARRWADQIIFEGFDPDTE
jgi:glycerophosphoryl diester phosphodiesterase